MTQRPTTLRRRPLTALLRDAIERALVFGEFSVSQRTKSLSGTRNVSRHPRTKNAPHDSPAMIRFVSDFRVTVWFTIFDSVRRAPGQLKFWPCSLFWVVTPTNCRCFPLYCRIHTARRGSECTVQCTALLVFSHFTHSTNKSFNIIFIDTTTFRTSRVQRVF